MMNPRFPSTPEDGAVRTDRYWQTFTMEMMLRSLHIDLKFIGYDKVEQKWIE